jgi:hypothetical protein
MSLTPIQSSLQLAALLGVFWLNASGVWAQQPAPATGRNPYGGQWSLKIEMATAPGGATVDVPGGPISPYNCSYRAERRSFQVKEDGTYEWSESNAGTTHHEGVLPNATFNGDRMLMLRASGLVVDPLPPEGPAREDYRRVTLKLAIIGGDGYSTGTSASGTSTGIGLVSADWSQLTNYPGGTTIPNPAWVVEWTLKPSSVRDEELGPEVIRRTTTYEGTRPSRIPSAINGLFTPLVTERIEVKHVRYLKLVPRG